MVLPSVMAGTFMGLANFMQGTYSEIGEGACYLYSSGALLSGLLYTVWGCLVQFRKTGKLWSIDSSNLFTRSPRGHAQLHYRIVCLLLLRASLNFAFIYTILASVKYASLAGMNQGIMTNL